MTLSGLLNLDKPYGMTSFKITERIRRRFRFKKIGHAGTLDPLATGVLLVCFGKATRLIPYLLDCRKGYHAMLRLGVETETQDREGRVLSIYSGRVYPPFKRIKETLERFTGEIEQIPPMYSALRYKGRRLYKLARNGQEVHRESRRVFVYKIECLAYNYPFLLLDITCSRGTYIRTIASDIGNCLGTGAHLWGLKRVSIGNYDIGGAVSWTEIKDMDREGLKGYIIPIDQVLSFLPSVTISSDQRDAWEHGQVFPIEDNQNIPLCGNRNNVRVFDMEGCFLGLGDLVASLDHVYNKGDGYVLHPSLVLNAR